jgi:hypothetical protein
MGLSAPLGLWNLSDLSDVSGNGRPLSNKGAVGFAAGINGASNTAAQFIGSTAQVLYISDTGAADSFRIKVGSWGCWLRTAKRSTVQAVMGKWGVGLATSTWWIGIANNLSVINFTDGTTNYSTTGVSDICDDRWHFLVSTFDGSVARLFVDGILEAIASINIVLNQNASAPLNIGGQAGDGATAPSAPHFGRIDEAFVTADVLSEDQIRNLYCAKIPHTLAAVPSRFSTNIRRRRRGAALVAADFPTQPLRLHNFSAGSLGDEGSNNVGLTNNGAAVPVAGADGASGNAFSFNGAQSLSSTDAGLPAGVATRSYGCWFKTTFTVAGGSVMLSWGTPPNAHSAVYTNAGTLSCVSGADGMNGAFVSDGQWHFVVVVEDNGAIDGVKRKFYCDGRLVGSSLVLNPLILGAINHFRIGSASDGSGLFTGQIDGAFVCDYALTFNQIAMLYAKSLLALTPSPKNPGDHIEAMDATNLLAIFDTLDTNAQVDLKVAS